MSTHSSPVKRVGIIGIFHESNTFIPEPTTLDHYRNNLFLVGEEVRRHYGKAHHEISGFLQTLDQGGVEAVPVIFAHATPWGKVSDETLDFLWEVVVRKLEETGPLDGILASPHGAGVNESRPDMDGWWLSELRKLVGPGVPVIATMDPHVNLSPRMVNAVDAAVAYRENPHLDQFERGAEAASLMLRTLRGEIRPVCKAAFPPLAINIERQYSGGEPILSVQRRLDEVRSLPGILSASLAFGFPYADVEDMGSAVVVVADGDARLAEKQADEVAAWLMEHKENFRGVLISPEEAIARVAESPKPVGLLDMGDNTGGGAPSDSTVLAHLLEKEGAHRALVVLADAESVQAAHAAGEGARVWLRLGGKLPQSPAPPLEVEVTVESNSTDGNFVETQPRHGGKTGGDMGPTSVVRTDRGLTVLLTTRRCGPSSAQPVISRGLDPMDFDVIVIKGVHAPVGAYKEICPTLIRVNTPGVTTADMDQLVYRNRRVPLFPFEEV